MARHARPEAAGSPDPLLVRDQPALRTGRRRNWLVPSGVVAAIAVAMLAATRTLDLALSILGIALVVAIYAAMVVCAFVVPDPRRRSLAFAWLALGLVVVAALTLLLIIFVVSSP